MGREGWQATVHGNAKSWTRLRGWACTHRHSMGNSKNSRQFCQGRNANSPYLMCYWIPGTTLAGPQRKFSMEEWDFFKVTISVYITNIFRVSRYSVLQYTSYHFCNTAWSRNAYRKREFTYTSNFYLLLKVNVLYINLV